MILSALDIPTSELEGRTGWTIKPEGACKAEHCVPIPQTAASQSSGRVDVRALAKALAMPLVADEKHGVWALGPESGVTGRALTTARAPELSLPDLSGSLFELSSLHGQKVLLLAWASW